MAVFQLSESLLFPPVHLANEDGLLAVGGDLSPERILRGYASGIFPWYNDGPIRWWSPDPRFVLFPQELHISHSMRRVLQRGEFTFSINRDFPGVIRRCRTAGRRNQHGTWITDEMEQAYLRLHELGYAHSAEAWQKGRLAGGLYGIRLGLYFCGESMFSEVPNASKAALIRYTGELVQSGCRLIDCQVFTPHLASLGARLIPRRHFLKLLESVLVPLSSG